MSFLVRLAAVPRIAISQVNGPHRILVIFRGPARTRVSGLS